MTAPPGTIRHHPSFPKHGGFTLLELLLCVSILSVVMASLLSYFHAGRRAWREVQERIESAFPEHRLFELLDRDLDGFIAWRDHRMVLSAERLYFHVRGHAPGEPVHRIDYVVQQTFLEGAPAWDIVRERRDAFPENGAPFESVVLVKGCSEAAFEALAFAGLLDSGSAPEDEQEDSAPAIPKKFFAWSAWKHPFSPHAMRLRIVRDGRVLSRKRWLPAFRFSARLEPLLEIDRETLSSSPTVRPCDEETPA